MLDIWADEDQEKGEIMKKFVLLHYGYETPTPEIMDAWGKWFASMKDKTVENVGPFGPGREITHTGTKELPHDMGAITGFTIINAENIAEAEETARDCPTITSVRVYEVMSM
jgi:hypothetical protein